MLYIRILEKILHERDTKRSQYAQLVRVCESTIQEIRVSLEEQQVPCIKESEGGQNAVAGDKANNNEYEDKSALLTSNEQTEIRVDSEKYFLPLELASKGDSPKVTVLALDGIQKLLAHGHLIGNYPNSVNPNKRLIDTIVETICACFNGAETDEGVELQIIKALLTVVTSQYVQIHEGSVLLTLRTCFNIYLLTRNQINQTTSRAMLTQMLHSIFTRMEIAYEGLSRESLSKIYTNMDITPDHLEQVTSLVENWGQENIEWFNQLDLSSFFYIHNQNLLSSCSKEGMNKLNDNSLEDKTTINSNEDNNSNSENGQDNLQSKKNMLINNTDDSETTPEKALPTAKHQFEINPCNCPNILQKDAFLVFWAVCKLAATPNVPDELDMEMRKMIEQKSTILSFQLVKSVLQNCGPVFQSSQMFRTAVKQYLCTVLREIGVSPIQEIHQLNLDLVIILIDKFRNAMVDEIEKLLENILFPVLENPTSFTNEYKILALGTMNRIYNNVKSLMDLILSQEAEEHGMFERMINYTCKLTNSEKYVGDSGSLSALPIRMLAVESIASLLYKMSRCLDKKNDNNSQIRESLEQTEDIATSKEETENPASLFVSTLFDFLENVPDTVDVIEVDLMIQTNAQNLFEKGIYGDNFESADALYALMYTSIGLIGELSSKQGKRRVNKEWFVKFNQSDTKWYQMLPDEFLELVFEEIDAYLRQQVKHRKHQNASVQSLSLNIMHNAKKLIATVGLHQSTVLFDKQVRSVKKMFKIMGKPVLNSLMGTLIIYDDATVTDVCLNGIQHAIHISAVLNLKIERDAYVQALSRLSLAALKEIRDKTANALVVTSKTSSSTTTENGVTKTTITTTTETKCRNVDIILTLLNVATNEGNYLNSTWLDTLKCISFLEASELMQRNGQSQSRTPSPNHSMDREAKSWYEWAGSMIPNFWDNSGSKLDIASVKQSMDTNVNRIFLNSTKLDENAIVEFFKALCQVSLIEITHPENPRSFVYEKIFEVAHINVHRPCLQWCSIWQVLSDFFSHLACSSDEDVSFFAIDSITKLVVHFLEKETVGNFRFQNHFLKPYETVMQNTPFLSTREYVLGAIAKIVRTHAPQLRSGWIPVFRILESSVFHDAELTAEVSFTMIQSILYMFSETKVNLRSSYPELLRCLTDLSFKGPTKHVRNESLKMLQSLAGLVHNRTELFLDLETPTIQHSQIWKLGWLPIFKELSNVVIDSEKYAFTDAHQANALTIVFELVKQYGDSFHASWWQSLFGVLFTIFNKLKFHGEDAILAEEVPKPSTGYNKFYCYYYVQFAIIDTFIRHYDMIGNMLMETLLKELEGCIGQAHDQIALSGVQCLHQLIRMLHRKMSISEWTLITKLLQTLLQTPPLIEHNPVIQLELLKVVKTILIPPLNAESKEMKENEETPEDVGHPLDDQNKDIYSAIGDDSLFALLDTIEAKILLIVSTHKVTKKISQPTTTTTTATALHLQETLLMDTYLRFLMQIYFRQTWSNDEMMKIESRFVNGITNVLECFVSFQPITPNHMHDLTDIMTTCVVSLHQKVPSEKFLSFATILYPNLCDLLDLDLEPTLSTALAKYFLSVIRLKVGDKTADITSLKR